ncbi:MAG: DUF4214 domain-containing protein, partial [Lachnospiraceae bacterium]|nr:DUF4214 domain-containing protein [Lachnospiraceae bacterium]
RADELGEDGVLISETEADETASAEAAPKETDAAVSVEASPEETEAAQDGQRDEEIRNFLITGYTLLGRQPDETGIATFTKALKEGTMTGADIFWNIVNSKEFKNKKHSNKKYVTLLYQSILGRKPDKNGLEHWVGVLKEGFSRNYVLRGFVASKEFRKLCEKYNIKPGSVKLTDILDTHVYITQFVNRLYKKILNRNADDPGRRHWVESIVNGHTAADTVLSFVNSKEFRKKELTDLEYLTVMYNTILDREPDQTGLDTWLQAMEDGMSRRAVLANIIGSPEFKKLCDKYGVVPGKIEVPLEETGRTPKVYIKMAYKAAFGADADANTVEGWVTSIAAQDRHIVDLLKTFIFSDTAKELYRDNSAFVKLLYKALLGREPNSNDLNARVNSLYNGQTREEMFYRIVESSEFKKRAKNYGLEPNRRYQVPADYYQIVNCIRVHSSDFELSMGYMGLKVARVQRRLGLGPRRAIVDLQTLNAVKAFQEKNGLKVDGIVGLNTWRAMGFSDYDWYHLDAYVSPDLTCYNSTREDHIEAMIETAMKYRGDEYVIGAAGAPGNGADCSGLVMQALFGSGVSMYPIDPYLHTHPGYEYTSRNMWNSDKFLHVPYSQRQRGDLIFYQKNGVIIHVAIYLGNDTVIESWPNKVVVWPVIVDARPDVAGCIRVFP